MARKADKCKRGHDLRDAANIIIDKRGRRGCRACANRVCARPGCGNAVPPSTAAQRMYCSQSCRLTVKDRRRRGLPLDLKYPARKCAGEDCDVVYVPTHRNLKWHSDACRKLHFNRRNGAAMQAARLPPPTRTCPRCGTTFQPKKPMQRWCSIKCWKADRVTRPWTADLRERYTAFSAKKRMKAFGSTAEWDGTLTLGWVIERDRNTCWLCNKPCVERDKEPAMHPLAPTMDHVLPLSKNGPHTRENVRLAHRACNRDKWDDTCKGCDGPITELGEPLCAECLAKGKRGKQNFAVCRHCGYVEPPGGYCSRCKAKGADTYAQSGLTRKAANALRHDLGFQLVVA